MQEVITQRVRDYVGPVTNTDVWDDFALRADDIIVTTPPKCGTTWTLNIIMMLIFGQVVPDAGNRDNAPWLDCAFRDRPAIAASQAALTRRRCLKSHTPMDGIAFGSGPDYIVVYRHPVDVHFSFRSHVANMKDPGVLAEQYPANIRAGFDRFLEAPLTDSGTDDLTVASIIDHYAQARAHANAGNVHFFHYADLSRDLHGQIVRLADLLNIDLAPEILRDIAKANTFANMRKAMEINPKRFDDRSPFFDQAGFYASGSSNKWEGVLNDADIARYDARIADLLAPEDVAWLNWGDRGAL